MQQLQSRCAALTELVGRIGMASLTPWRSSKEDSGGAAPMELDLARGKLIPPTERTASAIEWAPRLPLPQPASRMGHQKRKRDTIWVNAAPSARFRQHMFGSLRARRRRGTAEDEARFWMVHYSSAQNDRVYAASPFLLPPWSPVLQGLKRWIESNLAA